MIRILCSAVVLTFLPFLLFANEDNIAHISLITGTTDVSEPFYIGIYFDMEEDWYIYWENPGDAGIPVDVRWDVPEGYTVGELLYPTPERFDTQGLISFGYKNEALLLARVSPVSSAAREEAPVITADVSWMVCKESCILEDGTAVLNLNDYKAEPELIEKYKERLPLSIAHSPVRISSVETQRDDGRIRVTIRLAGEPVDDFFPGPVQDVILSHKDIIIDDNIISYTLQPYSGTVTVERVTGLLFVNGTAYRFDEPVSTIN